MSQDAGGKGPRAIDWEEYSHLCQLIAKKALESGEIDAVVGIAHGGVVVGATVASILHRDFFPIKFSRRVNAQVVRKHSKLIVPPTAHLEGKNVLIVDDASISGETMRAAAKEIKRLNPKRVITAVLVQRGAFEPDFSAAYAGGEVAFPWQTLETASEQAGAGPRPNRKDET